MKVFHKLSHKRNIKFQVLILLLMFLKIFQTYICTQQLESVCWHKSGLRFASSHNDGSYALWDVSVGDKSSEEPITLYGPFPCKAVTKLLWLHAMK